MDNWTRERVGPAEAAEVEGASLGYELSPRSAFESVSSQVPETGKLQMNGPD